MWLENILTYSVSTGLFSIQQLVWTYALFELQLRSVRLLTNIQQEQHVSVRLGKFVEINEELRVLNMCIRFQIRFREMKGEE